LLFQAMVLSAADNRSVPRTALCVWLEWRGAVYEYKWQTEKHQWLAAAAAAAAAGSQLMVANEVAMGERQACERLCVLPTQGCNPLGDVRGVAALVHLFYRFSKAPANEKRPSDNNGLLRGMQRKRRATGSDTPTPRWFGQLVCLRFSSRY
jgi:hypothetical protein